MIGRDGLILLGVNKQKMGRWLVEDNGRKGHQEMVILGKIRAQGGHVRQINMYDVHSKHNVAENSHRGPRCVNDMSWYY
jgi:hypothetical protein